MSSASDVVSNRLDGVVDRAGLPEWVDTVELKAELFKVVNRLLKTPQVPRLEAKAQLGARKRAENLAFSVLVHFYSTWELFRYSGFLPQRKLALSSKTFGLVGHDRIITGCPRERRP